MESAVVVLEANGWRNSDLHFAGEVSAKCNKEKLRNMRVFSQQVVCPEVRGTSLSVWPFQPVENYDYPMVNKQLDPDFITHFSWFHESEPTPIPICQGRHVNLLPGVKSVENTENYNEDPATATKKMAQSK